MPILTSDAPVALENLDDHLKAILKLKLREFVHLTPCFADIPSIDVNIYPRTEPCARLAVVKDEPPCPNHRHVSLGTRRRPLRPVMV